MKDQMKYIMVNHPNPNKVAVERKGRGRKGREGKRGREKTSSELLAWLRTMSGCLGGVHLKIPDPRFVNVSI
jgi:hypothetical protein